MMVVTTSLLSTALVTEANCLVKRLTILSEITKESTAPARKPTIEMRIRFRSSRMWSRSGITLSGFFSSRFIKESGTFRTYCLSCCCRFRLNRLARFRHLSWPS